MMKQRRPARWLAALTIGLVGVFGLGLVTTSPSGQATASMLADPEGDPTVDVLYFSDGRVVQGTILDESSSQVRVEVRRGAMTFQTTFNMSDITRIQRDVPTDDVSSEAEGDAPRRAERQDRSRDRGPGAGRDDADRVYVLELTGEFGRDISPTPVRDAVRDAQRHEPDYLIVVINNDWWDLGSFRERDEDEHEFQNLSQAMNIEPVLSTEIRTNWDHQPKVVFWVKRAMGGAAFLPFMNQNIYFHPDARMGGIGNLRDIAGRLEDSVREKMQSAFLSGAEGMAIRGGHDPRIVRAMARVDYWLSYRMEGGRPVLYEREPDEEAGEVLLTNDGQGDREDSDRDIIAGEGKNVLTLDAELAEVLGISRGTASSLEDLMRHLGIERSYAIVEGRSERVMSRWKDGLRQAERRLRNLQRDYEEIQPGNNYSERSRARGQQRRITQDMINILDRYGEVLDPGENIRSQLRMRLEQIRQAQMRDRR